MTSLRPWSIAATAFTLALLGIAPISAVAADGPTATTPGTSTAPATGTAAPTIAALNHIRVLGVCPVNAGPDTAAAAPALSPPPSLSALPPPSLPSPPFPPSPPSPPPPLAAHPQLDAAAAELARGAESASRPLSDVLRSTGYRATRSMSLQVSGVAAGAALARFIGQRYCHQLISPDWQEIGLYQRFSGTQPQTWLVLASPFAPPPPERAGELGARVLTLVNLARREARVCGSQSFAAAAPLVWSDKLERTGQLHAADMAAHGYFSHDGRDGSKPAGRATRAGYAWRAVGENIAAGQTSAETAVQAWIDSPPHCANLMGPQYTEMGVAYAVNLRSPMGIYWAQLFGTPRAGTKSTK